MSLFWWLFGYFAAKDIGNAIDEDARGSYKEGYRDGYDDALSDSESKDEDDDDDEEEENRDDYYKY